MIEFEGCVEKIKYRNEENGYTVLDLSTEEDEEMCCVGIFSYVAEGNYISVQGELITHPKFGLQLKMSSYEQKQPKGTMEMERYLGSGAIKGIGPALALRIVTEFGEETFKIIEREPERLSQIKGISNKMAISIANQFNEKEKMRQAMIFLQNYGISMNMAVKIYKHYGDDVYEILKSNPYRLADEIGGIGFKIADNIAKAGGFILNSEFRIRAGIVYALNMCEANGHCYLPSNILLEEAVKLLEIDFSLVEKELENLLLNREIVSETEGDVTNIYNSKLYYMEMNCARMLLDLNLPYSVNMEKLEKRVEKIEKKQNIVLDALQRKAVYTAVQNGVTIITGGPGTGKTTTINMILQIFEEDGMDVLLAAPTGRAAKRMSEATDMEAQTIHRLLELTGGTDDRDGGMHFERNETNPLEADVIIVDEFSMVDIYLLNSLLKAIVPGCRLIIVGDTNQLPSVGPGNVLKDMIKSEFCSVAFLSQIFRQASESQIVMNAHRINEGEEVCLDNNNKDFFFLERNNSVDITKVILQLVVEKLPGYVDASPYDIQVLSPMKQGDLGVVTLNSILQRHVNPQSENKEEREFHNVLFREKDKVMQIKNDYQIKWKKKNMLGDVYEEGTGVFNGDVGFIENIDTYAETVEIIYDGDKRVEYDFSQMEEVELAYAITIHKSQGSEYPAVVIPLLSGPSMLMTRNLLYTAVTRAKKCVTIVGSENEIRKMVKNVNERKRYSGLCKRIIEMKEEKDC